MVTNGRIGRLPHPDEVVERAKSGDVDDSMNSLSLLDLEDWELEPPTGERRAAGRVTKHVATRGGRREPAHHRGPTRDRTSRPQEAAAGRQDAEAAGP